MKNILFVLSLILWCSCNNDMLETIENNTEIMTRTTSSGGYSFEIYGGALAPYYQYDCKGNLEKVMPAITSCYKGDDGNTEPIVPEVLTKPIWVDSVVYQNTMYYGMFACYVHLKNNTSSAERRGELILKQPGSDKTLSLSLFQESSSNKVDIKVNIPYANHYVFTATTNYPVKEEVRCYIPYEVYNDGGKMDGSAVIVIAKGQTTGTYVMDYNGSPLVVYHGAIKGYNLYEGQITGDNIYTYSFVRYW